MIAPDNPRAPEAELPPEERLFSYLSDVLYHPERAQLTVEELPPNLRKLGEGLAYIGECLVEAHRFGDALAHWRLNQPVSVHRDNPLTAPLKTIQANLAHLTFVAQSVALGNYDVTVDYMGDFSEAFQVMISQLNERTKALQKSALTDALTGLGNRPALFQALNEIWQCGWPFAVLSLDVDKLKAINDRFGHAVGDKYLLAAVAAIAPCLGAEDVLCRVGGDEFVGVSVTHGAAELEAALEQARESFSRDYSPKAGFACGFSFGVIDVDPRGGRALNDCLTAVDMRMYAYKKAHNMGRE